MIGESSVQRSSVNAWNGAFLEAQYEAYRADPASVPADVRSFFRGYELGLDMSVSPSPVMGRDRVDVGAEALIAAFRGRGHLAARLDPFGRQRPRPQAISLEQAGLSETDLDRPLSTPMLGLPSGAPLRTLAEKLERTYLGDVGVEFMHVEDYEERDWLLRRWEELDGRIEFSNAQRTRILEKVVSSGAFEGFLQKRYPGEKRFSLEGAESLIPLLDEILNALSTGGCEEVVLGMAHRGRLNVLNQILGKTPEQIFTEFEDSWTNDVFVDEGGDVKYHRGYSAQRTTASGATIHVAMASNPSHLEAVDPVVMGRTRAKQWLRGDDRRTRVVPVLIHGDAAIAGQGIVAECLNFSRLEGYTTGGTIHVVVNNHIGFTTRPEDARSTTYCTDIAKAAGCPVFHVNGENPEAVVLVSRLAAEYRQAYNRDVFIDLWCYRRYGHNEQDEQAFTQPLLAKQIKATESVVTTYAQRLVAEGVIAPSDLDQLRARVDTKLDTAQQSAKSKPYDPTIDPGSARWAGFSHGYSHDPVETGVSPEVLREVCRAVGATPEGFDLNPKLTRLLESRRTLWDGGEVCYADGELLAFGTLLLQGIDVRLSGQDSRRGTFSSRHAVLYDQATAEPYSPLHHLSAESVGVDPASLGRFTVYDSPLSEASVLGFEYGYSLAEPRMLVCWEAQFGDFVNGAQVIIDQFIASAQVKWERWSGLVMLLPHGYEGAGPEHSSARLERFLEVCGNDNMQVVFPSTGAQIFHLLRRHVMRNFRKPLIVMAPKSLLRTPTSAASELISGRFHEIIDDPERQDDSAAKRVTSVLLCTGKIYHELAEHRRKSGRDDTAIIRVEQLYPFHADLARAILSRYPDTARVTWVQEEPRNMGAYRHIAETLRARLGIAEIGYIGREASASPAPGSKKKDRAQQESVIRRAVGEALVAEGSRAAG
jgi:2-oxoglutarate dehydrogenase E1 component